jgi:hypothetical protein
MHTQMRERDHWPPTCDWLCDEWGVMVGMVSWEQRVVMQRTVQPVVDTFCWTHVQKQKNDDALLVPKDWKVTKPG